MSVYVDTAWNIFKYMRMCHMVADTEEELHAMAEKIGLKRKWFQKDSRLPHYDVCQRKRKLALKNGAVEISRTDFVKMMKERRDARTSSVSADGSRDV